MLNEIVKIVKHKKIFKRNKRSVETKIPSVILYHRGLSYRDSGKILSFLELASYEAVHYCYNNSRFFLLFVKKRKELLL